MRICTVTGNKEKGVKIMPRPYLGDPKYTIEVLQKYNFAFQKRFGQNFLIDTHVLDKIIDSAQITKDDFVLEIGPGIGTMTQYLAEAAREVAAVEIDKTLLPILDDTLKDWDNVTVINNDILKVLPLPQKQKQSTRDSDFSQRTAVLWKCVRNVMWHLLVLPQK